MSYTTYTTEGIVCGSTSSNTSDKSFLIFTRDAGMVFANARSVREERSKQRYALQDFSHIRVSLLKGKSGWRIGSVESLGNPFLHAQSRTQRGHVSFVVHALRRYVHGEVALPDVYDDTLGALSLLDADRSLEVVQRVFLLRLFSRLGYIASAPLWREVVSSTTLLEAVELYTDQMEHSIEKALQKATQVSHL